MTRYGRMARIREEAEMTTALEQRKRAELNDLLAKGCREFAEEDREIAESILGAGSEHDVDDDE